MVETDHSLPQLDSDRRSRFDLCRKAEGRSILKISCEKFTLECGSCMRVMQKRKVG